MHRYFIKTPWFVKRLFSSYVWNFSRDENAVYLSFDDGPHPQITPWVLDELKNFEAKATFFCIGKNVEKFPELYQRILNEGHAVGNHTYSHMNGWKVDDEKYIADVAAGAKLMQTKLFRPPYGRIRSRQAKEVTSAGNQDVKIIMWDVLSADFDKRFSPQQCLSNVTENADPGSIIVFHDSEKAFENLKYALPASMEYLKAREFDLKKIEV